MLNFGKISAFIILTFINLPLLYSQGELVEEPTILYKNERSIAGFITSNGFGGDFRYGKRVNARQQILYQVDFMILKHPKEIKLSNNYFNTRQNFVFGKINNFFEFKGFIGRQHEIFRKNDRGGISIRYNYNIGPVIGILKPIYYEIVDSIDYQKQIIYTKVDKFSTSTHQPYIIGRATFFKGFDELSIIPGGSIKAGLSFEYSREDIKINALEVGLGLDIFPKKIPILASNRNSNYFFNLIVSYRFGKVIDISEAAKSKTWKEKRAEMKLSRKVMKDQKKDAGELDNF